MKKVTHKTNNKSMNGKTDSHIPNEAKIITIYGNDGQFYIFKYDTIGDRTKYWEVQNSNNVLHIVK
jgi:hypothetical protein